MAFNTKPAITRTFIWVVTISRNPDRQARKSQIACPNFGKSRFPESSQVPNPVKIFCVFPNPVPYVGQIPDPENTLPDPDRRHGCKAGKCRKTSASHVLFLLSSLMFPKTFFIPLFPKIFCLCSSVPQLKLAMFPQQTT